MVKSILGRSHHKFIFISLLAFCAQTSHDLISIVSGSSKNGDPIIIILGPPGSSLPSSSGAMGQIESALSDRDSSGSISRSSFNLFRSSSTDKKDKKDGPHIIFIGGSAASPMNNNNNNNHNGNNGPIMGSMQGPPNLSSILGGSSAGGAGMGVAGGPGMNNFIGGNNNGFGPNGAPNLQAGPMRRGSNGPGISVSGTNSYAPYPINPVANSGSMAPNYPYIPYVMGGYNAPTGPSGYPASNYDYPDYSWSGWRR
ncbi:epsin-like [Tetranychus urticae]|uniref:Uncharacterized protein n=1 Tax=Tetranychus urticae TaxID=32264 RepID=T1KBM6_TETUR|nr:epsin-like [Tetranychus urticae]